MEIASQSAIEKWAPRILRGGIAGFTATVPMTVFMLAAHRALPKWQRYPLPPKRIAMKLAERVGLKRHLDKPQRLEVTLASHFGYGTAMGSLYALTAGRAPLPALLKGTAFGLVLWIASYAGWLPAMDILPPPNQKPANRSVLMIVAHLVWGSAAGLGMRVLDSVGQKS